MVVRVVVVEAVVVVVVVDMLVLDRLLDSLVAECWLRVREAPGFNIQSRATSYQRRYKNGTSSALV